VHAACRRKALPGGQPPRSPPSRCHLSSGLLWGRASGPCGFGEGRELMP
jgi:hypothetical protein